MTRDKKSGPNTEFYLVYALFATITLTIVALALKLVFS